MALVEMSDTMLLCQATDRMSTTKKNEVMATFKAIKAKLLEQGISIRFSETRNRRGRVKEIYWSLMDKKDLTIGLLIFDGMFAIDTQSSEYEYLQQWLYENTSPRAYIALHNEDHEEAYLGT